MSSGSPKLEEVFCSRYYCRGVSEVTSMQLKVLGRLDPNTHGLCLLKDISSL